MMVRTILVDSVAATWRRVSVAAVLGAVVAVVPVGAVTVSRASAASPWWHLSSAPRPVSLRPGTARNDVQEVAVHATEGTLFLALPSLTEAQFKNGEFVGPPPAEEHRFFGVAVGASAAEFRAALEPVYGAGNVTVTGGPGGEPGTPYRIEFIGALADQPVALLRPLPFGLSGGQEKAFVTETVAGQADGEIVVSAENVGDADVTASGSAVVVSDVLPAGWRAVAIAGTKPTLGGALTNRPLLPCSLVSLSCTLTGTLAAYDGIEVRIAVVAEPGVVSGEVNEGRVSGGGAPEASIRRPVPAGSGPLLFGVEDFELAAEEEGGVVDTQAGSHPFQLTTTVALNQTADTAPLSGTPNSEPVALPKDVITALPPGLIGNPTPFPRCTVGQFLRIILDKENECSPQSAVGVALVTVHEPNLFGTLPITVPIFNLEPAVGEPARFGFYVRGAHVPVVLDTSVRTGGDYGVTVSSHNISQAAGFLSAVVTFWGVPGDPRHDNQRGWACLGAARQAQEHAPCNALEAHQPPPLLALPTSCTGPLQASVEVDPWVNPGSFQSSLPTEPLPALDGCNRLPFSSSISVAPDGQAASTPTGLTVDVHVPQDASLNATGLTGSDVKDIAVTLPEGVVLNPAAADGLQACSETQVGYLPGQSAPPGNLHFTAGLPGPFCPDSSKVGTVKIKSPLLPNALEGAVYLAAQNANPFGSLIAMYIVAKDPVSGVLVKLPGEVSLDPSTGRITSTFTNNPQLPFEDAELHFFGGDRAPLATPAHCGTYTTEASFVPWSGNAPVKSQSSFNITSGPNGSPCSSVLPFTPSLAAGTTNIQAGAFSPLTTTITRQDGNQNIQSVRLHMPAGLSGILAGVKLCGEAQANAGTCGPESVIGHTIVSVGLGGDPFSVTGGQVFLTESYKGAPFGLSIVNPAKAGPFDLGKVVVRAKIEVDPHTTELTITTDASGPYAIPHILDGIPLQIKHVNVTIDRPEFTFNPTNCSPLSLTGTISSVEGGSSPVAVPFQATNCAILKFAPKFSVSTSGRTSRKNGASLTAKLTYPKAAPGTQTNIARVKVDLPKQLPSRLTTLQKACTNIQFETNPANCPAASKIGHATVTTPLLPVPLNGPAIFVSHGGEAFPSLTIVLQGYGVTVDLVGTTFISKKGITSTTFKTVPDVPFNTFTLTLPQGKYSALAANGNLCKNKLAMPTEFTAQNGLTKHQTTKITATNCTKHHNKHDNNKNHNTKHNTKHKH